MGASFYPRISSARWAGAGLSKDLTLSRNARRTEHDYPVASPVFHLPKIRQVFCCSKLIGGLWVFWDSEKSKMEDRQ